MEEVNYYISKQLTKKWDRISSGQLAEADEDRVYVVDGRERSGKSVFTLQQAYYIDRTIVSPEEARKRIVFTAENFLKAVRETQSTKKETKVIIFDEAFRGLSSRSMMSRTNKAIIQALMEMGQKNLVVFIVLPSFFMLDLYPAMLRSNALFHIKKDKRNPKLRTFHVFNYTKKSLLYQIGVRKGWQYKVYTKFKDRFFNKYPTGDEFEKLYRQLKVEALNTMPEVNEKELNIDGSQAFKSKPNDQTIIDALEEANWNAAEAARILKANNWEISDDTVLKRKRIYLIRAQNTAKHQ